MAEQIPVIART